MPNAGRQIPIYFAYDVDLMRPEAMTRLGWDTGGLL
jgi:hypothetical protein